MQNLADKLIAGIFEFTILKLIYNLQHQKKEYWVKIHL